MKEKNIKLIMELIFIFILPLLFILPNVSINNNYVYDNDGNFETSSKELTYDSIVYNEYYKNYLDFNQLLNSDVPKVIVENENFYSWCSVVIDHIYLAIVQNNCTNGYIQFWESQTNTGVWSIDSNNLNKGQLAYNDVNYKFLTITDYDYLSIRSSVNSGVGGSIWQPELFDLTQMFGSGYEPNTIDELSNYIDLSIYYNFTESDIIEYNTDSIISSNYNLVKSPFIYIKDLISGFLNIDKNNISFNIVIDYTSIWFLMFVLWHFVYCLFDFIIHLIRIKRKE